MQCPECKSKSIVIKDGMKRCEAKGCTFIQFHVITYENENRQFEGEKTAENRFNSAGGMQNRDRQQKYMKNFYRSSVVIRDLIHTMKLSVDLQDRAEAKLIQILKIKYPEEKNSEKKIGVSDQHIGAYSLWLACCDKKMEFKDVRIANEMGIKKGDWAQIHKQMEHKLKSVMTIPLLNPDNCIRRICSKRKIDRCEQQAMLQMLARIREAEALGGKKSTTIAGFVFWQIMQRSSTYNKDGNFNIHEYLNKSSKRRSDGDFEFWTQKEIDVSYAAIQSFGNEPDVKNRLQSLIPRFKTRMQNYQQRNNRRFADDRNEN